VDFFIFGGGVASVNAWTRESDGMSDERRTIVSNRLTRPVKGGGCMSRRLLATLVVLAAAAFSALNGSNPWGP
jgi:hypothetical protein